MANPTPCQTPGAQFHTRLGPSRIEVSVDLPAPLDLTAIQAEVLEANLHNVLELVLAPHFAVGVAAVPPSPASEHDFRPVAAHPDDALGAAMGTGYLHMGGGGGATTGPAGTSGAGQVRDHLAARPSRPAQPPDLLAALQASIERRTAHTPTEED